MEKEINNLDVIGENYDENLQLAENAEIDIFENIGANDFENKRKLLEKTRIVKQTWSILEVFQKINDKKLILDPNYQRREIWKNDKKTAFIESLYMGIIIPPIYVVEVPSEDILKENRYEVVDGKQRLTAILDFLKDGLNLSKKDLEYFSDLYEGKCFTEINNIDSVRTTEMLSSVLDIYVITANSPEFTKYDIFARLNKGAEKLKVNEIRRAIYHSKTTEIISDFITKKLSENNITENKEYKEIFSNNDIKRFEDYGRFYRSIAFFLRSNTNTNIVEKYNSRPREMINTVLQVLQDRKKAEVNDDYLLKKIDGLTDESITIILDRTVELKKIFSGVLNDDYLIDACIPFVLDKWENIVKNVNKIKADLNISKTLEKSPATTSNVNERLKKVSSIISEQ